MVCLSLASLMLSGATPAGAAIKKSPAQIAAESNAIAERREACRLEAVEKKLSVLQRRKYIKECMAR
jgi:hypothetical protein